MRKNKTTGIILLLFVAFCVISAIVNSAFSDPDNLNMGYYVAFFGGLGAVIVIGLLKIFGNDE